MAKKLKKFLKKAGKAAAVAAALYGATKLGRRKKVFPETENINIGVGGPQIEDAPWIPRRATPDFDMNVPYAMSAKGGRIGAKKGGHVKSMGIAKRGGGVAKR